MGSRYIIYFTLSVAALFVVAVTIASETAYDAQIERLKQMEIIQFKDMDYVHISSSTDTHTFRSTDGKMISDIYLLLRDMEIETSRKETISNNYYKVKLSSNDNNMMVTYTFYDTGFVTVEENAVVIWSSQTYKLVDETTVPAIIDILYNAN